MCNTCTKCKKDRPANDYLSKGKVKKQCFKCRESDRKSREKRKKFCKGMMLCPCSESRPEQFRAAKKKNQPLYGHYLEKPYLEEKDIEELIKIKCKKCNKCMLAPGGKAFRCKARWMELRQRMADSGGCVDCGCTDIHFLEADHVTGAKVEALSQYMEWKSTEAMEEEFKKTVCRCKFDHRLKSAKTRARKSMLNHAFKMLLWNGKKSKEKMQHHRQREYKKNCNFALKMQRGECETCGRKCDKENQAGFDWAHIDRSTKRTRVTKKGKVVTVTVSDIVNDDRSPRTALPMMKHDTKLCRLQCANCHKLDTDEGI